jgi:hypothetical protein
MDRSTEVHLDRSTEFRLGCSMDRSTEVHLDRSTVSVAFGQPSYEKNDEKAGGNL